MFSHCKKFYRLLSVLATIALCIGMASCGSDEDEYGSGIAGVWQDGKEIMTLGKDGSYYMECNDAYNQYRKGTYYYNSNLNLLVVDIEAIPGNNSAYQVSYIVQTLTDSELVLLYIDGDVEGRYTRISGK